jgi:hypothetical protein
LIFDAHLIALEHHHRFVAFERGKFLLSVFPLRFIDFTHLRRKHDVQSKFFSSLFILIVSPLRQMSGVVMAAKKIYKRTSQTA